MEGKEKIVIGILGEYRRSKRLLAKLIGIFSDAGSVRRAPSHAPERFDFKANRDHAHSKS